MKKCIVTRKLSLKSIKVETEKPISVLAQGILNRIPKYTGVLDDDKMEKIAAKSQDCVDLFIECGVDAKDVTAKTLQIIIENKITSPEEKPKKNPQNHYEGLYQTERYYTAFNFALSACYRSQPCKQLLALEWLCHIVISTAVKPLYLVVKLAFCSKH